MSKRVFQLVAGLVVILAALTPLMECFDHWDNKKMGPASDTEIRATAWFVSAGIVLTMADSLRYVPSLTAFARCRTRFQKTEQALYRVVASPQPTCSPPPIPLRI